MSVFFWQKEIVEKTAHKMLVKLASEGNLPEMNAPEHSRINSYLFENYFSLFQQHLGWKFEFISFFIQAKTIFNAATAQNCQLFIMFAYQ